LKIYAEALINELTQSICDREKWVTGIPLHMQTLAEAFHKKAEIFCLSLKSEPELRRQLCLGDLYMLFIADKLDIFHGKEKIARDQQSEPYTEDGIIIKSHQQVAFKFLFPELGDTVIKPEGSELSFEKISRIGILQYVDDEPDFIHRSFADYYVAKFLVKKLTKHPNVHLKLQHLFHKILMEAKFQVIRLFMDGFFKSKQLNVNLEQYGKQIYKIWTEDVNSNWTVKQNQLTRVELRTIFHQAAKEGNFHIIGFLLDSLKAASYSHTSKTAASYSDTSQKATSYSDTIKDLLLHRNSDGETVWQHLAAQARDDHKETLKVLRCWAQEMCLKLNDDLSLAEDVNGHTA
jgi:hypothetical protein